MVDGTDMLVRMITHQHFVLSGLLDEPLELGAVTGEPGAENPAFTGSARR